MKNKSAKSIQQFTPLMFIIHYVAIGHGVFGMYGFDERHTEFIIYMKEITEPQYQIEKLQTDESKISVEYKGKFFCIEVSFQRILDRNITEVVNDNERFLIHDKLNSFIKSNTELKYVGARHDTFVYSEYIDPIQFIVMSGLITTSL